MALELSLVITAKWPESVWWPGRTWDKKAISETDTNKAQQISYVSFDLQIEIEISVFWCYEQKKKKKKKLVQNCI